MADWEYPCFVEKKDRHGCWRWICYSGAGQPVARSYGSFALKSDCEDSIMMARGSSMSPVYYIG